jgi:hypothetical protein
MADLPIPAPQVFDDGDYNQGSPTYDSQEQEFLKVQIDVTNLLEDFEHRVLRGEYKSTDIKTAQTSWKPMVANGALMNELGVRELMSRLVGKVSVIARLTYKEDEEIYKDMFYFDMSISELVAKRAENWDLDVEVAKSIKDACIDLVWDVVASSRNGFTAINLKSQYQKSDITRTDATSGGSQNKTFLGVPIPGTRK